VPSAVGGLAAVIATGGGLGIVLAGPIVEALSWRWLFWITMSGATVVSSIITGNPQRNGLPHESDFVHGFLVVTVIAAATVAVALLPSGRPRAAGGGSAVGGGGPLARRSQIMISVKATGRDAGGRPRQAWPTSAGHHRASRITR
jgi:hypothetical protein